MQLAIAALAAGVMAAAAPAVGPAPAPAAKGGPNVITQPDWLRRPTSESMAEQYPKLAVALDIEGYAVLACTVTAQGSLTDCRATEERPAGLGFGHAALALGELFQMKPMTLNGQAVDGGKINIPIRFRLPKSDAPPAEPPAPVSEEAARQAYRVIDSSKAVERAFETFEKSAAKLETRDASVAPGVEREAAAAFHKAVLAHRDDIRTTYARAFASVFSEPELSAIADFYASSAGTAQPGPAYAAGERLARKDYTLDLLAQAHKAFCAKAACDPRADIQRVWRADARDSARLDIPLWDSQPTPSALRRAQPKLAGQLGLTGVVRMTCHVAERGALTGCAVDEEAPAGLGYGQSALSVADDYRLSIIQVANGAVGRRVTVRVGFPPPEPGEPYRPSRGSAKAIELAHQLAQANHVEEDSQLQTEIQLADYATNPPKGADDKLYQAALDAYRAATKQALADYIDLTADNLSTAYSEAQLQAFVTFRTSPAGQAERVRRKELNIAVGNAQAWVAQKIADDARATFCAARDCAAPPAPQPRAASAAASTPKP